MDITINFSVVIPAYNSARFIEKALDSVRNQTYPVYEVLVTDDGSTDDTADVIRAYCEKYPDFPLWYAHQANKGIGGARNNGVFRATGHFIAFLDADDLWYPEKLAKMAEYALANRSIDVMYHDEVETASDGTKRVLRYQAPKEPAFEHLLFVGNLLSTSATCVRRKLAQTVGGFSDAPEFNSAEDYEFWLRLAKAGARFGHVPEVLGEYLRVEGSITSRIEYHHNNIFNVVSYHLDLLEAERKHPPALLQKVRQKRLSRNQVSLGLALCKAGQHGAARKYYMRSLKLRPLWWKNYAAMLHLLLHTVRGR